MITILGIGPGNEKYLLQGGHQLLETADVIIGSERQLQIVPEKTQGSMIILPKKLAELETLLHQIKEKKVVVLASGEPLLYGLGVWASKRFQKEELVIYPGISSIHYLFNKERMAMQDCFFTSSHGKMPNFDLLFQLPKVAMVTDKKIGPYEIAQECLARGLKRTLVIGENLSYPTEQIRRFTAEEVPKENYEMNVVVIIDEG